MVAKLRLSHNLSNARVEPSWPVQWAYQKLQSTYLSDSRHKKCSRIDRSKTWRVEVRHLEGSDCRQVRHLAQNWAHHFELKFHTSTKPGLPWTKDNGKSNKSSIQMDCWYELNPTRTPGHHIAQGQATLLFGLKRKKKQLKDGPKDKPPQILKTPKSLLHPTTEYHKLCNDRKYLYNVQWCHVSKDAKPPSIFSVSRSFPRSNQGGAAPQSQSEAWYRAEFVRSDHYRRSEKISSAT